MTDTKKKKKKKKSYSHVSIKPYSYKDHGFLSNLEMGSLGSSLKSLKEGYNYAKKLTKKNIKDAKSFVKKNIKDAVEGNFPKGSKFAKTIKKWDNGGKILKGNYTSSQRKTKQGSYRLYKKYIEAVQSGDMNLAMNINKKGWSKYKEDFEGRYHKIGKYGEQKKKNIKYG